MKKIVSVALILLAVGLIAAASDLTESKAVQEPDDSLMYMYWSGHGTGAWREFEIYYYPQTRLFEGRWSNGERRGWIRGEAVENIDNVGVIGAGTFGGDWSGTWKGTFYFRGECFGETRATTFPPGSGTFWGI
jgi:hypothetical protein